MNFIFFFVAGDFFHLTAMLILIRQILVKQSCSGLSLKTQILYFLTFFTRYMDIRHEISTYRVIVKLTYLLLTGYTVYLIRNRFKDSYDASADSLPLKWLITPGLIYALVDFMRDLYYHRFNLRVLHSVILVDNTLYLFSVYLESVALLPQLKVLYEKRIIKQLTANYVVFLCVYRLLYLAAYVSLEEREEPISNEKYWFTTEKMVSCVF